MFRKITARGTALVIKNCKLFNLLSTRSFANDNNDDSEDYIVPGGGLKTLCGHFQEDVYFKKKDEEWIKKMRAEGTTIKSIGYFDTWDSEDAEDFGTEARQVRGSCTGNKHKIFSEEAYFLEEQNQVMKLLAEKLKNPHANVEGMVEDDETDSVNPSIEPAEAKNAVQDEDLKKY